MSNRRMSLNRDSSNQFAPQPVHFTLFEDALGGAYAVERGGELVALSHYPTLLEAAESRESHWPEAIEGYDAEPFPRLRTQLAEYLAGHRQEFDLPLAFEGTDFQRLVWSELLRIPFGETRSYSEMARRIGHAGAARAVGLANHDNPIGIVVPCHRVIGADGSLTGYAGGLDMKRRLLDLEGALPSRLPFGAS